MRLEPHVASTELHRYTAEQPCRIPALRRALSLIIAERDTAWITTSGAIHDHSLTWPEGGNP